MTATDITITNNANEQILHGTKSPIAKLWRLPLPIYPCKTASPPPTPTHTPTAHLIIRNELDAEYVAFAHGCFGYPAVSTLARAAKNGWLGNFPRLTEKMILNNQPNSLATAKGHLDQTRGGMKSTQVSPPPLVPHLTTTTPTPESDTDDTPDHTYNDAVHDNLYTCIINIPTISHADATGRFPTASSRGTQYILFAWLNGYMHMERLRDRTANSYVLAYTSCLTFFTELGHRITMMRLDNETSVPLVTALREANVLPQYVPANNHRANKAERGIRTGKNHLIAILCGTDKDFPVNEWDRVIPQAELTLNHLRPYSANPTVSAYQGTYGRSHDFVNQPIAPIGIKVLIHEAPNVRRTWAPHGVPGFYLGPSLQHHRSYRVYCSGTRSERVSDSLAWFPTALKMPGSSVEELLLASIRDLATALTAAASSHTLPLDARQPFLDHSHTATGALQALSFLLSPHSPAPPPTAEPAPAEQRVALPPEQRVVMPPEQRVVVPPLVDAALPHPIGLPADQTHPPLTTAIPPDIADPPQPTDHWVRRSTRHRGAAHTAAVTTPPLHTLLTVPPVPTKPIPPTLEPGSAAQVRRLSPPARRPERHPSQSHSAPSPWPPRRIASASHIGAPTSDRALNLSESGHPLTFRQAIQGPDQAHWVQAEYEELDRLLGETHTMHAVPTTMYLQIDEPMSRTTTLNAKKNPAPTANVPFASAAPQAVTAFTTQATWLPHAPTLLSSKA